MMFGMTANQIGQSTHADWSVVSRPAARPRRRVQVAKQLDGGAANDFKLAGKVSHRDVRMIGMFGPDILIKTGKDRTVISGKDKSAIRHHALGVDDMSNDFLHRPFVGRISVISLVF